MNGGPQIGRLADGRLHLHHGPIDLIVLAEGPGRETAFAAAAERFGGMLEEIVAELDLLAQSRSRHIFKGRIANRMARAVAPFPEDIFVTPMAAVAGAVAEEMLETLSRFDLTKAMVNNGGDIAFLLTKGEIFRAATPAGGVEIAYDQPVRGLATSGGRGRSQSLGIADAVSVLARNAARADAAATLIANAVDLPDHPAIRRRPAHEVEAIPQLGNRLVTVGVGDLTSHETAEALSNGAALAQEFLSQGLIDGALLLLNGQIRVLGLPETVFLPDTT